MGLQHVEFLYLNKEPIAVRRPDHGAVQVCINREVGFWDLTLARWNLNRGYAF